ncbi:MAG TPA: arabinofuranosyltransferase [Actinophytocola sp.]|uniref:arabinofuranosyltransferase n=1 Tax=Actinophytocola sp. TaxID=1872138 RepID=UPI002DB700B0|nr:arabinofuranosyltransferase [Actinophytocola sp.]HEU5470043.1 arabinofuranosyltransferase [Actinophytocola sp.]
MSDPANSVAAERVPAPASDTADGGSGRHRWFRRLVTSPGTIAVGTWAVALPFAFLIPRLLDLNPFTARGAFLPVAAGAVLLVAVTALAWWRGAGEAIPAVAAGLFGAWVALMFRAWLAGTPHGTTGLAGDRVRVAAAATRYAVTPWFADHFVEELPPEYPPLYPWLTGRLAALLDVPAWRLLGFVEVGVLSLSVVVAFLMWCRLAPAALAFPLSAISIPLQGDPRKAFAVITLVVFVPWVISAFTEPPRGRLHWLPAGIIGGLIMLTYNGWFLFAGFGVFVLIFVTWRRSAERGRYVRHVLLLGATAFVVSAPFLVPYFGTALTQGGELLSDLWAPGEIADNGFPFLEPTLMGALQLAGLAGLLWYRGRFWWSGPMLYLVLGAYAWWLVQGVRFVFTGHTGLFYYAFLISATVMLLAAVLTLATAAPALVRKLQLVRPPRSGVVAVALLMVWLGFTYSQDWRPGAGTTTFNDYATWAHLEPLPDCRYPKYAPQDGRFPCYPVELIRTEVEQVRGTGDRPHTLATNERLFAYLPWRGYMGMDQTSANTLVRWDSRNAELGRLASITDPAEFARATADTAFGPIDVFVLYSPEPGSWKILNHTFGPQQFDPAIWSVTELEPHQLVVITRRPS